MGIQQIIDNRITVISRLNLLLPGKHPIDSTTPFRAFQNTASHSTPSGAQNSGSTEASLSLETQKGSRLYEVVLGGMPTDAGGNGVYNTLWNAPILVRVRYDLQGSTRTTNLASIDAGWITRSLMDPTQYGSVNSFEATSPPTTSFAVLGSHSLILSMTFPTLYYEDSLGTLR